MIRAFFAKHQQDIWALGWTIFVLEGFGFLLCWFHRLAQQGGAQ